MLVKYSILVKIQPIASDKRVRPKASNLLFISIEPLSLRASLCKILISSLAHKIDFAHNFSVDFF